MKMEIASLDETPVVVLRRTFDAPREVVWTALTEPQHVVQWYGGHGFANPVCEMDVRPGGLWRHVMRTPSGAEFAMTFEYVEVVRPERLVWRDVDFGQRAPGRPPATWITVTLEAAGRQTRWTMEGRFATPAERDFAQKMGFSGTIAEGCDKLERVSQALVVGGARA